MSKSESQAGSRRDAAIRRIVEEVMARRDSGDLLTDAAVADSHPDLMPELGNELRLLSMFERIRQGVRGSPVSPGAFPGYRIVGELHRGGQGVVFEAVHAPSGRKVAIKVLRDGFAGDEKDAARFEREIEILGGLEHPGIVGIHASGVHEGRFYYVMDFVDGVPLDEHAPRRPIAERLETFVQVCDAVNAAHLRGVIHRDLKPGNILVDAGGRVHVLDFGLARRHSERDLTVTSPGQFVGSLPWASPEQASGQTIHLDVRTDVYSLGVVLYRLLTGRFPYAVDGGPREALDNILRAEPVRPRAIDRSIPADLEAIVLKCLAKEPQRRYQSAGELGTEIRRYLTGWPVAARPPSTIYQLSRFARRNKGAVAAAGAVTLAVAGGVLTTGLALFRAVRAEGQAEIRRLAAEREARTAESVSEFLEQILRMATPSTIRGRDPSVLRDVLDDAQQEIANRYGNRPELEVRLRGALAAAYFSLGELEKAHEQAQAAVSLCEGLPHEPRGMDVALRILGLVNLEWGRPAEALPHLEASLASALVRGESNSIDSSRLDLAIALADLRRWDAAEAQLNLVLDAARSGAPATARVRACALSSLAALRYDTGRGAEALPLVEEAIAATTGQGGDEQVGLVTMLLTRSYALRSVGRDTEALESAVRSVELARKLYPAAHPATIKAILHLGRCLIDADRVADAEPLANEALGLCRAKFGPAHNHTAQGLYLVATCRQLQGHPEEAEPLLRQAIAAYPRQDPACPVAITDPMAGLAAILTERGELDAAEPLYRESLDRRLHQYGSMDLRSTAAMNDLATVLYKAKRYTEAEPLARSMVHADETLLPAESRALGASHRALLRVLLKLGKAEEALPVLNKVIAADGREFGQTSWPVASGLLARASCLIKLRRLAEAEQQIAAAAAMFPSIPNLPASAKATLAERLASLHEARGEPEKAAEYRSQAK